MKHDLETLAKQVRTARIISGSLFGLAVAAAMLIGGALASRPAAAQDPEALWKDRTEVVETLSGQFSEAPTQLGITAEGAVLELFTAPGGATWTLLVTLPNGMSRVIAIGESWMSVPVPKKGRIS